MKKVPTLILIGALLASGAGAAAGMVLSGKITGNMPVTVSQALLLEEPIVQGNVTKSFTSVSDDNTRFTAAVEVPQGAKYRIKLPIWNESDTELIGKLTLILPSSEGYGGSVAKYAFKGGVDDFSKADADDDDVQLEEVHNKVVVVPKGLEQLQIQHSTNLWIWVMGYVEQIQIQHSEHITVVSSEGFGEDQEQHCTEVEVLPSMLPPKRVPPSVVPPWWSARPLLKFLSVQVENIGDVKEVVRVSKSEWKMKILPAANGSVSGMDGLAIEVAVADDAPPGYYKMRGKLETVEY